MDYKICCTNVEFIVIRLQTVKIYRFECFFFRKLKCFLLHLIMVYNFTCMCRNVKYKSTNYSKGKCNLMEYFRLVLRVGHPALPMLIWISL